MSSMRWVVTLALLVLLPAGWAAAAPMKGFSLYGGATSNSSSGEINKGSLDGTHFSVSSSGVSLGGDFQLPVSDTVSLNFLFMSSSESASSHALDIDSAGHAILAVEGRYWFNDIFTGVHVGQYSEALLNSKDNGKTTGGNGLGWGVSVGWQKPNSGWYVMGQYDNANIHYSDATSNLSGIRAQVGYRWGMHS